VPSSVVHGPAWPGRIAVFPTRGPYAIIRAMSQGSALFCTTCEKRFPLDSRFWLCPCGGFLEPKPYPPFDPSLIDPQQRGLWRFRRLLPLEPQWQPVDLGEGGTPLLRAEIAGSRLLLKMEQQNPTGSFKDRGSAVLTTALRGLGVDRVVEDSSGNAGASMAAYAARAGIGCDIFVPSTASGPKLAQIAAYGAQVIKIEGSREDTAHAVRAAAARGVFYASHVYSAFFLAGVETTAFELWEQMDRCAPGAVVLPVGNGSLLLGLFRGYQRLLRAGMVERLPCFYAVQAQACAPLFRAFTLGRRVESVRAEETVATGIAVGQPARGAQILEAVHATGGEIVAVTEAEIRQAHRDLARLGVYVEPTSAAAAAAVARLRDRLRSESTVVMPLTGHGLKAGFPDGHTVTGDESAHISHQP